MQAASSNVATTLAVRIVQKTRRWAHNLLFDSYRPELHYMRGPGPKWREKHGQPPAETEIGQLELPGLRKAGA